MLPAGLAAQTAAPPQQTAPTVAPLEHGQRPAGITGAGQAEQAGAQSRVILSQPTLAVTHLAGQSYGSITANRGSDVAIDTTTLINVDLRGASPLNIGSAAFRIDALALETAMRLGR